MASASKGSTPKPAPIPRAERNATVSRIVKTVVHHDLEEYLPGDPIELTVGQAAQLDEVGALESAASADAAN